MRLDTIARGSDALRLVLQAHIPQEVLAGRIAAALAEGIVCGRSGGVMTNVVNTLHEYRRANLIALEAQQIIDLSVECLHVWRAVTSENSGIQQLLTDDCTEGTPTRPDLAVLEDRPTLRLVGGMK